MRNIVDMATNHFSFDDLNVHPTDKFPRFSLLNVPEKLLAFLNSCRFPVYLEAAAVEEVVELVKIGTKKTNIRTSQSEKMV